MFYGVGVKTFLEPSFLKLCVNAEFSFLCELTPEFHCFSPQNQCGKYKNKSADSLDQIPSGPADDAKFYLLWNWLSMAVHHVLNIRQNSQKHLQTFTSRTEHKQQWLCVWFTFKDLFVYN